MKLKLSVALNVVLAFAVVRLFLENLDLQFRLNPPTPAGIRAPTPDLVTVDPSRGAAPPAPTDPFRYHLDLRTDDLRSIAR